ncbi:MAG: pyridoxal phosphate-dependent aminotransferase [Oligoflexus sp.]
MDRKQTIVPAEPAKEWLESYFNPTLLAAKAYHIDTPKVPIKLDQNESPWDWPLEYKDRILSRVKAKEWNRYPEPYGDELHELLGQYAGISADCILTGPGSNMLIGLIIDALGRNLPGKVVIARPSFALFESHCRYSGIGYETWDLDDRFDFRLEKMPDLPQGSLVVFASPNNPTGSFLPKNDLQALLERYPDSYFLADEAYYEFNDEPYIELLEKHANLMILRTLSKTMGAAGVRLGYAIGAKSLIQELRKMRLPYLLNHFGMEAAKVILSEPEMKAFVQRNVENVRLERDRLYTELQVLGERESFWVKASKANFLLVKFGSQGLCQIAYQRLIERGVLVRNISAGPGLSACLRISVGAPAENQALLEAIHKGFS